MSVLFTVTVKINISTAKCTVFMVWENKPFKGSRNN